MKAKYLAAAGMVFSAAMIVGGIAMWLKGNGVGAGMREGAAAKIKEKTSDYESYTADMGDYGVSFDYLPGMVAYDQMGAMGVVTQDFYSESKNFITITVVPARYNVDSTRPRTADEYMAEEVKSGDIASIKKEAKDYAAGEWEGFLFRDVTEYVSGLKGYVSGYQMFCGDEYVYIFVSRNDRMPADIRNLKVEKIR